MSKGNAPKERAKLLVKALLEYEVYKQKIIPKPKTIHKLIVRWKDGLLLKVDAPIEALRCLVEDIPEFKPTAKTTDKQFSDNIISTELIRRPFLATSKTNKYKMLKPVIKFKKQLMNLKQKNYA